MSSSSDEDDLQAARDDVIGGEDADEAVADDAVDADEEAEAAEGDDGWVEPDAHPRSVTYKVVAPDQRRTSNILSRFEMTEVVSIRARQIEEHNNCIVDTAGLDDPILMAKRELMMRKCPLTLSRYVGDKRAADGVVYAYYEYWDPNEMQFSTQYTEVL